MAPESERGTRSRVSKKCAFACKIFRVVLPHHPWATYKCLMKSMGRFLPTLTHHTSLARRGAARLQPTCARMITTVGRVPASLQQDSARSFTTGIPVGAAPQLLVSAFAPHRKGASADIAAAIFEHGASIAATKKVMLENHFSMLISVWAQDPAAVSASLSSPELAAKLGFAVTVRPLSAAQISKAAQVDEGEKRRLKLTCPQKPGIVLAITELLKDQDCGMSSISADTMAKGSEIWFEIEAVIDVPPGVDADALESSLRLWTNKETKATLVFDTFVAQTA